MKKNILIVLFLIIASSCFAQKFEVIKELRFGHPIEYYEESDPNEGKTAGIASICFKDNVFYILDNSKDTWISLADINDKYTAQYLDGAIKTTFNNGVYLYGNFKEGYELNLIIKNKELNYPDYRIIVQEKIDEFSSIIYSENRLFSTKYDKSLIYWELLPEGKTIYHAAEQTKKEMEDGLAEQLGIQEKWGGIYFGENRITNTEAPLFNEIANEVVIKTTKYSYLPSGSWIWWSCLGTDKKGITYYFSWWADEESSKAEKNPDIPFKLYFGALDSWNKEFYITELPEGDWNPPRNKNGFIAVCSQCIDEDGNIYFTDCNKEKGCYEIKKLSNDWVKKYDFYNREVGRMNANHIPLQTTANQSSNNNGYNFDHEYLWILEHGKDLCKVRKVDGREGYVETKYINFGNENKSSSVQSKTSSEVYSKVAVNKILKASDNLRLRKEEATSSAIITTMQKGTKVKILKLGKAETIDGISSNWVQVEVLSGVKDKDGKALKAGIIGWCYGGYLE